RAYADAVLAELDQRAARLPSGPLRSVYFGGGTPSLWDPAELGRVLRAVLGRYPGASPEVTVECNPSSFDEDRGAALRDQGVNRVSLGVQGLDASRLAFLGRLHDADGALRALRAALAAGFRRVSGDLIFGLPGQTPEEAAAEAATLADVGVTHLSAYALTIEPGTRFGELARKGRLPLAPDGAVAESFLAVREALAARGFEHYEVSSYARPGERSRHNVGYWTGLDYLGVGAGAYGTVTLSRGRVRTRTTPAVDRYTASSGAWATTDPYAEGPLVASLEELSPAALLSERIMLGLRLAEGLDLDAAGRELGLDPWTPERRRAVARLSDRGRLVAEGGRLRVPVEATLLADGTIAELI
ncbi:MAG: coproporphyrinogen III oxidase family protein, partial [Deltaproteobacteria bacterium]|nr:coproporphyrinogen III oxidase family protein [Deltaproteobacteria bacterium]